MAGDPIYDVWVWLPHIYSGQTLNGSLGIQWTKTLDNMPVGGSMLQVGRENTVYIYNGTSGEGFATGFPLVSTWCGYSMTEGDLLWGPKTVDMTSKIPQDAAAFNGFPGGVGDGGLFVVFIRETMQSYAWNVKTGQFLWGPTEAYTNPFGIYNWEQVWIVNGVYYNSGYDGLIHAFNATTGNPLWTFSSGNAGTITPYGTWPFYNGLTIAGKNNALIATTGEHGNGVMPLYLGEGLYVLDATSGEQLWNITGWFCQPVLADGMMVSQNCYDNQIYCFGRGPSAATISVSPTVITYGSSVLIQGTVTDQSPGAVGTPAISDAYQNAWMNYLYQQQPKPADAKGVDVTLYVLDSNNNYRSIGTATTDINGAFSYMWEPDIPGKYMVIATFAGTESYWPSVAETAFGVMEAPEPTATPTPQPASLADLYFLPMSIGMIIAIVVVIILVALILLRKR
jgi:hypothetical protein